MRFLRANYSLQFAIAKLQNFIRNMCKLMKKNIKTQIIKSLPFVNTYLINVPY